MKFKLITMLFLGLPTFGFAGIDRPTHFGNVRGFDDQNVYISYKGSRIKIARTRISSKIKIEVGQKITWAPIDLD